MSLATVASSKFALLFLVQLILATLPAGQGEDTKESGMTYRIETTWDGLPVDHEPVSLTLVGKGEEGVEIKVQAPFFGIPGNPGGEPGKPFDKLWNYEVVEMFFADGNTEKPKYLEVELCPWGQHLVLLLDGVRNAVRTLLPIKFNSSIDSYYWTGSAIVPPSYFPPRVTRFNAYAIHDVKDDGTGDDPRRYESLFPVPTGMYESADFHRLEYFQPIDFESVLPGNYNANLSDPWPQGNSGYSLKEPAAKQTRDEAIQSITVTADKILYGGTVPKQQAAQVKIDGVSTTRTAHVNIVASGFLHNVSKQPNETFGDLLRDEDLDQLDTLRVYIANSERRLVEMVFTPSGQYDVRIYHEPYVMISKGHKLPQAEIKVNEILYEWTVKAQLPLSYLPKKLQYFNLASVYPTENGTQYETSYSITNAGICLPDLLVIKKFQTSKAPLLKPILNEAYSDLWEEDKK